MRKNRIFRNASWIIGAQVVKAIIGFFISILTARYLGPSNYGLINYAASIVTFVTPIMYLGLNSTLVQEVVNHPDREGETIGTAIVMGFFSSVLCILGIISFTLVANPGEWETTLVCGLYSSLLLFQSIDLVQFWFQAKLLSKYSSIVSLFAYVVISAYQVFLLATQKSIYWFALSQVIDYAVIAAALIIIYRRIGNQKLVFRFKTVPVLFENGKYYIIANLAVSVFAQTDRIMLKIMVGNEVAGYYGAAAMCAGVTSFVFSAIITSFHPVIFEHKNENEEKYENSICTLYSIIIYASVFQCILFTFGAGIIIRIMFGSSYEPSVSVLRLLIWYTTFSYIGSVRSVWMLAENKQKYLWILNVAGAGANILLNYFLIPVMGASGAALASLVTQFFTNILMGEFVRPIRKNNRLMFRSLNPKYLLKIIKTK